MKVKKSLETPDGPVTFEGELSPEELDVVIGVGLNYLMAQGALPFKVMDDSTRANAADGGESIQ